MKKSTIVRTGAVGAVCALAGGAIGIAGSSASSSGQPSPLKGVAGPRVAFAGPMLGLGPLLDASGPPVHADAVVPNEKGGFDTVTMDRGSFSSLSRDQLTITEGTKSATYKTVTLTIPSNATVRRNEEKAQLSDLKAGDEVIVVQGPNRTLVLAHDAQHPGPLALKVRAPLGGGGPPLLRGEDPPWLRGEGPPPRKLQVPPGEGPSGLTEKGTTEKPSPGLPEAGS
jgi:hypothetical protein